MDQAQVTKDTPHPTDKSRSLVKDAQHRLENYLKRKEQQTGRDIWSTKEVAGIKKNLREEYFPKKSKAPVTEAPADTKVGEKFEPFYENESAGGSEPAPAQSSDEPAQSTSAPTGNKPRREGKFQSKGGDRRQYR